MVNFADRARNPSLTQARTVLNILQTHCAFSFPLPSLHPHTSVHLPSLDPERLGRALVVNVPFLVNAFFKLITPFIDPLTRPKLRFNPDCVGEGLFDAPQLLSEWSGGAAHFEYDHVRYWGPLVRLCAERREKLWAEWRALGGKIGIREWDMRTRAELAEEEKAKAKGGVPIDTQAEAEAVQEEVNGEKEPLEVVVEAEAEIAVAA